MSGHEPQTQHQCRYPQLSLSLRLLSLSRFWGVPGPPLQGLGFTGRPYFPPTGLSKRSLQGSLKLRARLFRGVRGRADAVVHVHVMFLFGVTCNARSLASASSLGQPLVPQKESVNCAFWRKNDQPKVTTSPWVHRSRAHEFSLWLPHS